MKKYLFISLLIIPFYSFSQIDKIGYSKAQILSTMDGEPCKSSYDGIWYCLENGNFINYSFKNNLVSSVLYMWEFKSKYEADKDVNSEIAKAKIEYGRPEMMGDKAFWFSGNLVIMVAYGYANGKHYSSWRVSEK